MCVGGIGLDVRVGERGGEEGRGEGGRGEEGRGGHKYSVDTFALDPKETRPISPTRPQPSPPGQPNRKGEDSAIKKLAGMDVLLLGCHTHSPPPLSLYPSTATAAAAAAAAGFASSPSSPSSSPFSSSSSTSTSAGAGGGAGAGVGAGVGLGVSARGRDVSERNRYSNGRMPVDRVSYDDAALVGGLVVYVVGVLCVCVCSIYVSTRLLSTYPPIYLSTHLPSTYPYYTNTHPAARTASKA